MTDRPNVVVLVLDTTRADHLPPHEASLTPRIAAAAEAGTAVSEVFATAPWTLPSHGSLFSGAWVVEHGIHADARNASGRTGPLRAAIRRQEDRWLPEALRRAGYRTWAVSTNVWVTKRFGFDFGFDRFVTEGKAQAWDSAGVTPSLVVARQPKMARWLRRAARKAADWLGRRDAGGAAAAAAVRTLAGYGEPFFGFVNLMEAHVPYVPPRGYRELKGRAWMRAQRLADRRRSYANMLAYNLGRDVFDEDDLATLRLLYRGELRYLDTLAGRILDAVPPNTIVLITADHGEALGEHHTVDHQLTMCEEVLRVPFVVTGAPVVGEQVSVVSLREVPETVARWAGVDPALWRERARVPPRRCGRRVRVGVAERRDGGGDRAAGAVLGRGDRANAGTDGGGDRGGS